jgi:hypothetical protein
VVATVVGDGAVGAGARTEVVGPVEVPAVVRPDVLPGADVEVPGPVVGVVVAGVVVVRGAEVVLGAAVVVGTTTAVPLPVSTVCTGAGRT